MRIKETVLNSERNVKLTAYIQDVGGELGNIAARPAVMVFPGGGYYYCSDREADPVAVEFLRAGFQVFILRYTTKKSFADWKWDMPMQDYEQAIKHIDDHAEEYLTDKSRIAVCGFSAGGHLAAYAATTAKRRPAAALLGYAALYGKTCDALLPGEAYPADLVDGKTCPCFIFAARDDSVVDIESSIRFQQALKDKSVNFEAHVYSFGNHAFTCGEKLMCGADVNSRINKWTSDAIDWLGEVWGEFTATGFTEPKFERALNENLAEYLSVKCTMEHLQKQSQEVLDIVNEPIQKVQIMFAQSELSPEQVVTLIAHEFMFRDILKVQNYTDEQIDEIDAKLKQIPNKIQ